MHLRRFWFSFGLFLLVIFALLLGLNMRRGLNHDEHQFLASGKLVAQGLLPYQDFPYFHAPTLSLVYGLLFRWFDPLLLSARLFSVICAWLGLAVIGGQALRLLPGQRWPWRWLLAISIVLLLSAAPLFIYTSGRAWNHDLPVLLMVVAMVVYGRSAVPLISGRSLWLSGFLIGLAASARLSFVFLAPAFLLAIWWDVISTQRGQEAKVPRKTLRLGLLASLRYGFAFLIGFSPALWLFAQAPTAFLFGNVEYVQLNTLYYRSLAEAPTTLTLLGKFSYLLQLFGQEPGNLLLGLSFVAALVGAARSHAERGNAVPTLRVESTTVQGVTQRDESSKPLLPRPIWAPAPQAREGTVNPKVNPFLRLIFFALLFMLLGALIATPSQAQYFYALLPLLALGSVYALAGWRAPCQRWGILGLSIAALIAVVLAIPQYAPGVSDLLTPTAWYPNKLHRRAQTLATLVGQGKVLTLAPLYPLEGNVLIYPALATGSFVWRVTPLVEPERRARLGLFDPTALAQHWQADPPRGVLVGSEQDDAAAEAVLIALAQAQGYVPVEVLDKQTLWLSPLAEWGGAIRLGAHTLPQAPVIPGESLQVVFYLQNIQPISQDLNMLVRFVGEDGAELLRSEGWPWGSATSTWSPGAVWPDGHEFVIPVEAKPGVYRVEVSFYDPATFVPLGEGVMVGEIGVK